MKLLRLSAILTMIAAQPVRGDLLIDDFALNPDGERLMSISAPGLKHYVTFLRQTGLDPKHTIGGNRSAALNTNKMGNKKVTAHFDGTKKVWRVVYSKGAVGYAFVSYNGGTTGERRQLKGNLAKGGHDRLTVKVSSAPKNGKLSVVLYAGREFGKQSLPIEGPGCYDFLFSGFDGEGNANGIDPSRIDGIGIELHVGESTREHTFEISKIVARKGEAKPRR